MALPKIQTPSFEVILPSTGNKLLYRPFLVKEEKILLVLFTPQAQLEILKV